MFATVCVALAVCMAMAAAALVYAKRPKFPDTVSNRRVKTLIWMYLELVSLIAEAGEKLGFSGIRILRRLYDIQLILDRKLDTVEEYTTEMDGVEVTVFKPACRSEGLGPGMVHFHGGGWVYMEPAHLAPLCRQYVEHTKSVLVSVNYRRPPEHLFPIPVEDCLTATRYFLKNAEQYGVDPAKIGVIGESAGGNLAMAIALRLAKEADPVLPRLKFMALAYPPLQALDFKLPSYIKHSRGPGCLHKDSMVTFWLLYAFGHLEYFNHFRDNNHTSSDLKASMYGKFVSWEYLPEQFTDGHVRDVNQDSKGNKILSDEIQDTILDPMFAPLMATDEDLSLLPQTYITSTEYDVLRDEVFIAAGRLEKAGVEVQHNYLPNEQHGVFSLIFLDDSAVAPAIKFSKFFRKIME